MKFIIIILFSLILFVCADDEIENENLKKITLNDALKESINNMPDYIGQDKIKEGETCIKEKLNFDVNGEKTNTKIAGEIILDFAGGFCMRSIDDQRESFENEFDSFTKNIAIKRTKLPNLSCAKTRLQQLAPNDELIKNYRENYENAECNEFIEIERSKLNEVLFTPGFLKGLNIEECMEAVTALRIIEMYKILIVTLTEPVDRVKLINLRENYANISMNQAETMMNCILKNFN